MLNRITSIADVQPGTFVYPCYATEVEQNSRYFLVDISVDLRNDAFAHHVVLANVGGTLIAISPDGSVGMFHDRAMLFTKDGES